MSTKEERPTLAGAQIKTRKRNIAVPLDPGSFADAVITICEDAKEGDDGLEKNLGAAVKGLESANLDFSRYGDTLFEVLFAGGRMAAGGNVVGEGKKLEFNVMASEPNRDSILPYVKVFQTLIRRRPFLIKALENTLVKLLKSLDFYEEATRVKLAIATARIFAVKLGCLPDRVLPSLMNDRMVAKGTILQFVTEFFKDFLATDTIDDLVLLLRKAKLDNRLLDFFPPQKRTLQELDAHFKSVGLDKLVEYNSKKVAETHLEELNSGLVELVTADPPHPVADCVAMVKAKKQEWELPDTEVIKIIWTVLIDGLNLVGKNAQQITGAVLKQVRTYKALLTTFAATARLEAALIVHVQVACYEDSKLLKLFSDIVRILYDNDILAEDTIKWWYTKGSHPKGRGVFLRDIEPFIKWLDEAEEDEDDEEE
ncbi:hypothetical protein WJX72_005350 [[Myrmecia] bisecta]|uniref:W2 domain-containing protein n=1 Tax=[Myrmecia] bisecta TaxID=41462 RepID=A0AAW1QQE8_9CHLO